MAEENEGKSFGEKFAKFVLMSLLTIGGVLVVSYIIACYWDKGELVWDTDILATTKFTLCAVLLFLTALLFVLTNALKPKNNDSNGAKVKTKGKVKKFYDTHWLTKKELESNPKYMFNLYSDLHNTDKIGIPIRAEYVGGRLRVNMFDPIHTLIIGTTGSGKTSQLIDPYIQILSETHARPCMVIADPKGEIYTHHSDKLRKRGYKVHVFDLANPFNSTCWNPMTLAYDLNYKANTLYKHVKIHRGMDPRQTSLKLVDENYYDEWYELNGFAFGNKTSVNNYLKSVKQSLKNESFEVLRDIATTLCPIESNNDPIWERGAKDLILGTMLAMLEDSENPDLDMTRDKYNFYTLSRILNIKDNDAYNPMRSLQEYFQGRNPLSLAVQLANQVITNSEKTARSYMGIVTDRMGIFSDMGICYSTSKNEMQLDTFCDQASVLFIKIPDEKVTRHSIATLFISQLYKILVDVARDHNGVLPRDTYFLLDEFGNLPKIQNFESMITVARSRRIWFVLVLQSYAQLTIKYGEQIASTVKDNCNIHIFLASNDQSTLDEFSKRCGNITVETESVTVSKGKEADSKNTTTAINQDTRPLIYPAELGSLGGDFIVYIMKNPPLRTKFTPAYKLQNVYDINYKEKNELEIPKMLDEEKMYYDIKKRNDIILRGMK